jgi:hypothetical protein
MFTVFRSRLDSARGEFPFSVRIRLVDVDDHVLIQEHLTAHFGYFNSMHDFCIDYSKAYMSLGFAEFNDYRYEVCFRHESDALQFKLAMTP